MALGLGRKKTYHISHNWTGHHSIFCHHAFLHRPCHRQYHFFIIIFLLDYSRAINLVRFWVIYIGLNSVFVTTFIDDKFVPFFALWHHLIHQISFFLFYFFCSWSSDTGEFSFLLLISKFFSSQTAHEMLQWPFWENGPSFLGRHFHVLNKFPCLYLSALIKNRIAWCSSASCFSTSFRSHLICS